AEPLRVPLQIRQPRLVGTPFAVGPYAVLDALPQDGTIEVRAPAELRLQYQLRGEITQREISEEQRRENVVAVFAYWNLTAPAVSGSALSPPPLTLAIEPVKGALETRVSHQIRRVEDET